MLYVSPLPSLIFFFIFMKQVHGAKKVEDHCPRTVTAKPYHSKYPFYSTNSSYANDLLKLTQFFDQLLVLVELFECLNVHVWDFGSLGFVTMLLVTKNAH